MPDCARTAARLRTSGAVHLAGATLNGAGCFDEPVPAMSISQSSRQRVLDALAHREGGVPLGVGLTSMAEICATVAALDDDLKFSLNRFSKAEVKVLIEGGCRSRVQQ